MHDAIYYAITLIACIALINTMDTPYFLNSIEIGLRLKLANSGLIYKKVSFIESKTFKII